MTSAEVTREFYREQGRQQERRRILDWIEPIEERNNAGCEHGGKNQGNCGACTYFPSSDQIIEIVRGNK